ncbi:MAG: tRNA (adenosine(37)-N6)-dimethylallyltransferase MiaA [Candidatus Saccharimonadales bacterium]
MAADVNKTKERPLVVIIGQTASGKSDLAIRIARKHNGEIICADSRTIYKGMDIGTAKPSFSDRRSVKHHLLDVIEPDKAFSASDFKTQAIEALNDIYSKGKLPIVAGGTGLYINSLVYDFDFGRAPDVKYRDELQKMSLELLQKKVRDFGFTGEQIDLKNKRRLIRALENKGIVRTKKNLSKNTLLLGIRVDEEELKIRIKTRNEKMIKEGLEKEVRNLVNEYGWNVPGLNAIAYKEWKKYFSNEQNIDEVKENMFKDNWQYARRQKIWFKRDPNIHWLTSVESLIRQVDQFLIQY